MTSEAMYSIKQYYTDLRRRYHNIDDQDKTMPITPRQLESIVRLAEANAKMYLSETVDVKHADNAMQLMDDFLNITLGGDIDMMFSGLTAEQRKKDTDPRNNLRGIIKGAGPNGMDEEEIYDKMQEEYGIDRNSVKKLLDEERYKNNTILKDGYGKWRIN